MGKHINFSTVCTYMCVCTLEAISEENGISMLSSNSKHYIHLRTNALAKSINPYLLPQTIVKIMWQIGLFILVRKLCTQSPCQ